MVKACVQTPLSPQEKSEKGQPHLRIFLRGGEGGTRANWLEKNNLQKIIINPKELLFKKFQQTERTTEASTDVPSPSEKEGASVYRLPRLFLLSKNDDCVQLFRPLV